MHRPSDGPAPPLRLALTQAAGSVVLLVLLAAALVRSGPLGGEPLAYSYPFLAATYAGAGLLAWWRRPANGLGPLLTAAGGAWLVAGLQNTGVPAAVAVGLVTSSLPLSAVLHLILAAPGGRLPDRASRGVVGLLYVVALVLQVPVWAFTPEQPPFDVLLLAPRPDLASAGYTVQRTLGALLVLATVALLVRTLRRYDSAQRRLLAPLLGYGLLAVLAIPVGSNVLRPLLGVERALTVQLVALALVPVGFVAVVLRGGFRRTGELSALATSVALTASPRELEEAVARTLGDPSVLLLPWSPTREGYVDAAGDPVAPPEDDGLRGVVHVLVGERRLGALVYDARLNDDPSTVAAVGRVVAIALDRERLTQEVSLSRQALQDASARVLSASDQAQRRLARDLHDGLQGSLVRLSMQAHRLAAEPVDEGTPGQAARLAAEVDETAAALRGLVHGVMPAPLVEQGLAAAVQELAYDLPVRTSLDAEGLTRRLPPAVESTAYFVVAEALTNVVKHAGARQVDVSLRLADDVLSIEVADDGRGGARADGPGSGLPGLHDRLDVLGGSLSVRSDAGGTRLRARVPCA